MSTDRFPLAAAARSAAKIWTAVGGIVTGLAGVGIITADQNTALQGLLVAVVTLVGAGTSAAAAFGVRRNAEPLVTRPVNDEGPAARDMRDGGAFARRTGRATAWSVRVDRCR